MSAGGADTFRNYQRGTRNAGFIACLVGAMVMITGRYVAGVPVWLTSVGVAVIVFGWGLFAYSMFKRAAYARAHPIDANG